MTARTPLLWLVLTMLPLGTGCHGLGHAGGRLLAEGVITAAAIATNAALSGSQESSGGGSGGGGYSFPDPPDPSQSDPRTGPTFDEVAARAALRDVSLDHCRADEDLIGHVRVTFAEDGTVSELVLDEPRGAPEPVARCVTQALSQASAPSFHGGPEAAATTTMSFTLRSR